MTNEPRPAGVTPPVAVVFASVTFIALSIGGLGVMSLVLDADVIPVRGLGAIPGVIGQLLALLAFAGVLWWGLRADPPGYLTAVPCAVGAYVGEVLGIVVGAIVGGADPARGLAAAGSVALGFPGAVVAGAGLLAGLFGVLLVRSRSNGPRWRWEDDDETR
ncbi:MULTISPECIES: hypothetical protein [unclassified Microbacterium]|uniref:hypothetical protein n=1 Tax=unclassified Microbacterium TaxID=2609290 RepID=UPI0006F2D8CB|nr:MULTISPECIES: hypothetical protein [unclassified Microbacterium]KQR88810.1 hypothetical protein ASF96_03355 [Microbacterium sp. Leaf179]KQT73938.1 hypothetical protein ASG45_04835 [Microbacterium sp. Leaf436]MBD8207647.1 hypothetical protein [Microbacterium sp. CFBP 8801]MBD8508610.1 hypothetical protein [Microbacterium sp. CFBP 8790]